MEAVGAAFVVQFDETRAALCELMLRLQTSEGASAAEMAALRKQLKEKEATLQLLLDEVRQLKAAVHDAPRPRRVRLVRGWARKIGGRWGWRWQRRRPERRHGRRP